MFEETGPRSRAEVFGRMDALADRAIARHAQRSPTTESTGFVQRICAAARAENQAAAAQLVAMGNLFAYRLSQCSETEDWAMDTMEAVAAEVAAALRISQRLAAGRLGYARVMRERLPETAEMFIAGDISYHAFTTIASRTDLVTDPDVLARVDSVVAANVGRWPSMTRGRLSGKVDAIVAWLDFDALRRRAERQNDREIWIGSEQDGISQIQGALFTTDAHALDKRLSALAATVCEHDPRNRDQRRADALGALAAGADRLGCRCGRSDCAAGAHPAASPLVIHVIAERASLTGAGDAPAWEVGAAGLIDPGLIKELAKSAKLVPLAHPGDAPPESGYVPSKALADFVRCRDLTCRWPGCDVPAIHCDLDHSIPHAEGGLTHAGNLNCKCRSHHLVKTFWGWREQQLADGTLIFTSPGGQTYVTTPGSALMFPSLCYSVGGMPAAEAELPTRDYCGERTAMMPKRRRTRAQDRAARVATERNRNREARVRATSPPPGSDEPPPF